MGVMRTYVCGQTAECEVKLVYQFGA